MRILIVDDDAALAEGIALYLTSSNADFEIFIETDGNKVKEKFQKLSPDLIILDVLLNEISGYDLCKEIKQLADIPIIFLSSLGEAEDRINGLLYGGDDYLSKPFSLQELLLRINARLRDKSAITSDENLRITHRFGGVTLGHRTLLGNEGDVLLTETEYQILLLLARNQGTAISLKEIYKVVWGGSYCNDLRTVQTHTANLRKKLEEAYGTNKHIRTQWGQGYIFQG